MWCNVKWHPNGLQHTTSSLIAFIIITVTHIIVRVMMIIMMILLIMIISMMMITLTMTIMITLLTTMVISMLTTMLTIKTRTTVMMINIPMMIRAMTVMMAMFSIIACPPYSFTCTNGMCVSMSLLCDFKMDCQDGSDENHCGK